MNEQNVVTQFYNTISEEDRLQEENQVRLIQGNAMYLSAYADETFDITLSLGPMYHLFDEKSKRKALEEAIRVTKKNGMIFIAYCMNEARELIISFM